MATQKKSTSTPKKPAAKPAGNPKPKPSPDLSKISTEGVPEATLEAVAHCLKNGYHEKLRKVVADLPDDSEYKKLALLKADAMDIEAKAKAKAEQKKKAKSQAKVTPEQVLDKYDELHDVLAEFEHQEKMQKKPFRHAVVARRRITVFRDNFKRNCR